MRFKENFCIIRFDLSEIIASFTALLNNYRIHGPHSVLGPSPNHVRIEVRLLRKKSGKLCVWNI